MDDARLDALVIPTWSNPPAHINAAEAEYRGDNSQWLVPDTGLPAVTVPMGYWQDSCPRDCKSSGVLMPKGH
jgi:Asp-tRNA(Asn)/Glu-tRNA(Gln) amidotransferase A subunit family amidase